MDGDDRQRKASDNRARMPAFSAWLSSWQATFGPCRVYYARDAEAGVEAGRRFDDQLVDGRVPVEK